MASACIREFRDMAKQARDHRALMVEAYDVAADCRKLFDAMCDGFDVVLTPSAPGEARRECTPGVTGYSTQCGR
jgi:hypothetical protein